MGRNKAVEARSDHLAHGVILHTAVSEEVDYITIIQFIDYSLQKCVLSLFSEMLKEKDRWEIQTLRRAGHSIRHIAEIT
jgi:hypothetical protein